MLRKYLGRVPALTSPISLCEKRGSGLPGECGVQEAYQKSKEEGETMQIPPEIRKELNSLQISKGSRRNSKSFTVPEHRVGRVMISLEGKGKFFKVIEIERYDDFF